MIAQPSDEHRDAMMRALATSEQIVSTLPHLPHDLKLTWNGHSGCFSIDLYYHYLPEQVEAVASALGAQASTTPHITDETRTTTEFELTVDGVRVRAWSVNDAESGPHVQADADAATEQVAA